MNHLATWISYGLTDPHNRNKALVRRWLREFRERRPVIDRWNFPDDPHFQRG